jgi:hypothetical protein
VAYVTVNEKEKVMDAPIKCPECGATAVDPCQMEEKMQNDCVRENG